MYGRRAEGVELRRLRRGRRHDHIMLLVLLLVLLGRILLLWWQRVVRWRRGRLLLRD